MFYCLNPLICRLMHYLEYMKFRVSNIFTSLFIAITVLTSCSKENVVDIVGTWIGTSSYVNPVSGRKYQYLYVTFNSDKSGMLEYEGPSNYTAYAFYYKVHGNIVECVGAKSYSDGEIDANYAISFRLEGDRLLPLDDYTRFILTKDGSVETDFEGNELVDNSKLLENIWVRTDNLSVLEIKEKKAYEYPLSSAESKKYVTILEYDFSYDFRENYIWFDMIGFDILDITKDHLKLKRDDSKVYEYRVGDKDDIPTEPDLKAFLQYNFIWKQENGSGSFTFMNNSVTHFLHYDKYTLGASGPYTVVGNVLTVNFGTPTIEWGKPSDISKYFPGWSNEPCTKEYKVEVVGLDRIKMTHEGKVSYYKKLQIQ